VNDVYYRTPKTGRFEAVIFDLGNTLLCFDGDWPEVFRQSDIELFHHLETMGINLEQHTFTEQFRSRMEDYFSTRETDLIELTTSNILRNLLNDWDYTDIPDEIIKPAIAAMYTVSQSHWQPETDAIPTLVDLQKQGYRLGIISNAGDDDDVQYLVDKAQIRPYMDVILSSAAYGTRKPNPGIFHAALDKLGIQPSKAVMVGDKLEADILGAHNTGMFGIWITRRADAYGNHNYGKTIQPDAIIGSLSELPYLLKNLSP
jgi:2-haloalkanoic acid dehalogenase type II